MPSLTRRLCEFGTDFTLSSASGVEIRKAKLLLLDLIGVALAGLETEEAEKAFRACQALNLGGGGASSLWGTGSRAPAGIAALFNGIAAHALELDDFLGIDHTGAVVIPALLAVADQEAELEGEQLLEGLIFGYEIGKRLIDAAGGYQQHNKDGWHTTGTLGPFAAAAAVGKFLNLPVNQLTSALGLAGSFTGGTWAFNEDGAMSKRYHCGIAAQVGIQACYLAKQGFTGPEQVLEAKRGGYFNLYGQGITEKVKSLADHMGCDLRINLAGIKPYACCRGIHSSLDVVLGFKGTHGLTSDELQEIVVKCTDFQKAQLGKTVPTSRIEAQLSLSYSLAVAIKFGEASYPYFTVAHISDPELVEIARKIKLVVQTGRPLGNEPEVSIRKKDGSSFTGTQPVPLGDPLNPVSESAIRKKFGNLSKRQLPDKTRHRLEKLVLHVERDGNLLRVKNILGEEWG